MWSLGWLAGRPRWRARPPISGVYAARFREHAATYQTGDREGAARYQSVSQSDPWDWDGETEEYEPINPGGAAAGPNAGPAIPPTLI